MPVERSAYHLVDIGPLRRAANQGEMRDDKRSAVPRVFYRLHDLDGYSSFDFGIKTVKG